jgi:hypothetical protein
LDRKVAAHSLLPGSLTSHLLFKRKLSICEWLASRFGTDKLLSVPATYPPRIRIPERYRQRGHWPSCILLDSNHSIIHTTLLYPPAVPQMARYRVTIIRHSEYVVAVRPFVGEPAKRQTASQKFNIKIIVKTSLIELSKATQSRLKYEL